MTYSFLQAERSRLIFWVSILQFPDHTSFASFVIPSLRSAACTALHTPGDVWYPRGSASPKLEDALPQMTEAASIKSELLIYLFLPQSILIIYYQELLCNKNIMAK